MREMFNRIYEVSEGFHIDLGRIVAIRQFVEMQSDFRRRRDPIVWIEITMDSNQIIEVDCLDIDSLQDAYNTLLLAWNSYICGEATENK